MQVVLTWSLVSDGGIYLEWHLGRWRKVWSTHCHVGSGLFLQSKPAKHSIHFNDALLCYAVLIVRSITCLNVCTIVVGGMLSSCVPQPLNIALLCAAGNVLNRMCSNSNVLINDIVICSLLYSRHFPPHYFSRISVISCRRIRVYKACFGHSKIS